MQFRPLRADEIECICCPDGTILDSQGKKRPTRDRNGYLCVSLKTDSGWKNFSVHRLIAQCFLPNPDNKPCVNHKDGNKHNNAVSNLEWCTYSENEKHSYDVLGKKMSMSHMRKIIALHVEKVSKSVCQIDDNGDVLCVFKSQSEASRKTGISQGNISECCNGRRSHAGGYVWEFCLDH